MDAGAAADSKLEAGAAAIADVGAAGEARVWSAALLRAEDGAPAAGTDFRPSNFFMGETGSGSGGSASLGGTKK